MFTVNRFALAAVRSFFVAGLALVSHTTAGFAAQPIVKTVPWMAADSSVPHDTFAFKTVTLKGTSSLQGSNIRATWDFGDGSAPVTSPVTDSYNVAATHAYTGAAGTTYTARLTVTDQSTGEYSFANYAVIVREQTLETAVNVAIDEGLWYLHTSMNRSGATGNWQGTSCYACDSTGEATAWNVLAFERNGHLGTGDSADPYTETVTRAQAAVLAQMAAQQPTGAIWERAAHLTAADKTATKESTAATAASADAASAPAPSGLDAADAATLVSRQSALGYWLGNNPASTAGFETAQSLFALSATPIIHLAGANSVTNVSSQVQVTNTGFTFNRATATYGGNLTVKNITLNPIAAPITVGITNLPATVVLTNSNGTFNTAPYRTITASPLLAGASVSVPITFANPNNLAITFNRFTYSGNFPPAALTLACSATSATVGTPYNSSLDANGGVLAYTYSINVGTLPAGLNIDANTGAITGTPTTSGNVSFTARVVDSAGQNGQITDQPCNINVANAGQPDLTISKSHTGNFTQGSAGNAYTVIVTNSGTGDKAAGQSVSVTDAPPTGLTVTAMSGSGWTCTTLPTCSRLDVLVSGASYPAITVTVSVASNATSPQVNSILVTTAATESNAGNNTATDSTTIVQPDLTITKTHTGNFVQGSTGNNYAVTVTNSGAGDKLGGSSVSVTDAPPSGLTVTAMSGSGWTCTTLPTCSRLDVLASGASYPAITVTVSVDIAATSPQVNSITVTTAAAESNAGNNTATDSTVITTAPQPDLTISKSHTGNFTQGSTGNYTVVVTNSGTAAKPAASSVSVTDTAPSGLTVTAMSGSGWTCTTLPTCSRLDVLAPAASYPAITVTVSVASNATSPQVNSVSVTTAATESNAGNNTATDSTVIVAPPNAVPSFTKGPDQTVNEDTGPYTINTWATLINQGVGDSGQTVHFNVTANTNTALFSAGPAISSTGVLTYTLAANANGTANITITLQDDGGTANGGIDTSAPQNFNITVNAVNDAPTFTIGPNQTVNEDAGPQTVNPWATAMSAGPADEAGQTPLVFSVTGNTNAGLFSAGPVVANDGSLTYTPTANAFGTATITVRLTDSGSNSAPNVNFSEQTFTITVNSVNDAPSFTSGGNVIGTEDTAYNQAWATALNKGAANESGQNLTFIIVSNDNTGLFSAGPAISGTTGNLSFTPAANQNGIAHITVHLKDDGLTANGGVDTSSPDVSFTITVNAVNDKPVAAAHTYTAQANMPILIPALTGLVSGATDPNDNGVNGCVSNTFTYTTGSFSGTSPAGGVVVPASDGTFTFIPPPGVTGPVTFTYTVTDTGCPGPGIASDPATVTFNVAGPVIWFVSPSGSDSNTGVLGAPFLTMGKATTAIGAAINHRIFAFSGTYTQGAALNSGGWLIGQAVTGADFDTVVLGLTPPAGTIARPAIATGTVTLQNTVTVNTNAVAKGFNLSTGANTGLTDPAGAITGVTVDQMSVTSTTGTAVNLTNADGNFTFRSVSSNGAANGIVWNNSSAATGLLKVTGDGSTSTCKTGNTSCSGGTIQSSTGNGISLTNAKVNLALMWIKNNANSGIFGTNVGGFAANDILVQGNTNNSGEQAGILINDLSDSNAQVLRAEVSGSREDNVRIHNSNVTGTINFNSCTVRDNFNASPGNQGVFFQTNNSAHLTATAQNCFLTGNRTIALRGDAGDSSVLNVSFLNNTIVAGSPNQGNQGIEVSTAVSAVVTYAVEGNKIGTPDGTAAAALLNTGINIFNGTLTTPNSASISGTVKNNIIINDNSAPAFSSNGFGIRVFNNGYGTMNANVSGNTVSKISTDYGIFVEVASNSGVAAAVGSTSVAVTNNTASTRTDALDAIRVQARGRSVMCARISGNTSAALAHGSGFFGLEIRQASQVVPVGGTTFQATFNLEGLTAGLQTNHSTIVNYLNSQNPGVALADTDEIHSAGITGVAANSCSSIPN